MHSTSLESCPALPLKSAFLLPPPPAAGPGVPHQMSRLPPSPEASGRVMSPHLPECRFWTHAPFLHSSEPWFPCRATVPRDVGQRCRHSWSSWLGYSWHLRDRGLGCCSTSKKTQDSPCHRGAPTPEHRRCGGGGARCGRQLLCVALQAGRLARARLSVPFFS